MHYILTFEDLVGYKITTTKIYSASYRIKICLFTTNSFYGAKLNVNAYTHKLFSMEMVDSIDISDNYLSYTMVTCASISASTAVWEDKDHMIT